MTTLRADLDLAGLALAQYDIVRDVMLYRLGAEVVELPLGEVRTQQWRGLLTAPVKEVRAAQVRCRPVPEARRVAL